MKTCTKCGESKPLSEFFKYSGRPGHRPSCKQCAYLQRAVRSDESLAKEKATRAEWLRKTAEKRSAWQKEYYAKNKEACTARVYASKRKKRHYYDLYQESWRDANSEHLLDLARARRKANPGMYREYKVKRRLIEVRATPAWANRDAINAWYTFAAVTPGVHVDHIVPLNSPIVCGLHCEFNLQLIPASANMSKGNRFWPDMPG